MDLYELMIRKMIFSGLTDIHYLFGSFGTFSIFKFCCCFVLMELSHSWYFNS